MDLQPKLTPFWHEINLKSGGSIKFKLKPLTQPQVNELTATYEYNVQRTLGYPTERTWYKAGCMGMDGAGEMDGITIDGEPANWRIQRHREAIPHDLIVACGVHLVIDAIGGGGVVDTAKN